MGVNCEVESGEEWVRQDGAAVGGGMADLMYDRRRRVWLAGCLSSVDTTLFLHIPRYICMYSVDTYS